MIRLWPLFLALCLAAVPAAVMSQDERVENRSESLAEARSLFETGRSKLEAKKYAEAAEDFGRSLELVDRTATRFNLAVALCGSGKYIEGIEEYELLLRTTDLDPEKRNEVIQKKAEAETKLARIALTNDGPTKLEILVDGERFTTVNSGTTVVIAVNPGRHTLSALQTGASADVGWRSTPRELNLRSGQTESHSFKTAVAELSKVGSERKIDTVLAEPSKKAPTAEQNTDAPIWPWVVLAVAAVGGVAVAAILLSGGDEESFDASAQTLQIRF